MRSKYFVKKKEDTTQRVYQNEMYELIISGSRGQNATLTRKTEDFNLIIPQLIEDLSAATLKIEELTNIIHRAIQAGILLK